MATIPWRFTHLCWNISINVLTGELALGGVIWRHRGASGNHKRSFGLEVPIPKHGAALRLAPPLDLPLTA